jgi:ribosomal protein S18 acetylase RimI-like enzyme
MKLRDWRDADPAMLRACYDAERHYWNATLAWDTTATWLAVEQARVTWGLPGLIVIGDDGRPDGWAFYLPDGDVLSIGGMTAASPDVTALMLDAILEASRAQHAAAVSCFLPESAAGLGTALRERGFTLDPYLYLARPLAAAATAALRGDDWSPADLPAAAALLRAAYPDDSGVHFAPHGTHAEWLRYVTNLVEQTGCGALQPSLTRVARDGRRMQALALITSLGPRTAHLAQLAVDPGCRRQGLAAALVSEGMARAGECGFEQITLLVAESNVAAAALYRDLGFTPRAAFVAARLAGQPLRLTSVAPASGGRTTRR